MRVQLVLNFSFCYLFISQLQSIMRAYESFTVCLWLIFSLRITEMEKLRSSSRVCGSIKCERNFFSFTLRSNFESISSLRYLLVFCFCFEITKAERFRSGSKACESIDDRRNSSFCLIGLFFVEL